MNNHLEEINKHKAQLEQSVIEAVRVFQLETGVQNVTVTSEPVFLHQWQGKDIYLRNETTVTLKI